MCKSCNRSLLLAQATLSSDGKGGLWKLWAHGRALLKELKKRERHFESIILDFLIVFDSKTMLKI